MSSMQGFIASGDIYPCRFVKAGTVDGEVTQCGAGDPPIGISQKGTRRSPYIDTSGKAAAAGEPIQVHLMGDIALLDLAGTVVPGDLLKADTNGKGVVTVTNLDKYGGKATVNGTSGQRIGVQVMFGEVST